MKKALRLIVLSIALALLSNAVTLIGQFNLIWIVVIALFLAEFEDASVITAVLAGFLFDLMMGDNTGITGVAVLVGLGLYILVYSLGLITGKTQKIFSSLIIFFLAGLTEFFIKYVLGEVSALNWEIVWALFKRSLLALVFIAAIYLLIENWKDRNLNKNTVKL
jgi:cell shape-determining protein MreD